VDARSRPYRRDIQLKSAYGITQADYDRLLALQHGRCAICRATTPGTRGTWRVDHDHETGQVRGLLCDGCNRGIGSMQDDPGILMAAARYVMKHRQKSGLVVLPGALPERARVGSGPDHRELDAVRLPARAGRWHAGPSGAPGGALRCISRLPVGAVPAPVRAAVTGRTVYRLRPAAPIR
jgi:hypothetical protein